MLSRENCREGSTGLFGGSVEPENHVDEGFGIVGRLVVAPIIEEKHVLHLGVHSAYREPSQDSVRIRAETTHMSSLYVLDTEKTIVDLNSTTLAGAEAAWVYGPFSVFGEYSQAFMDRGMGGNLAFNSWHVATAFSLTGESMAEAYRIDAGEFKRLEPEHDFSFNGGTWGAWELAARVAALDANNKDIVGETEMVWTSGLDWYANNSVRFMIEWSGVLDTDGSNALRQRAQGMNIFQIRTQFTYREGGRLRGCRERRVLDR